MVDSINNGGPIQSALRAQQQAASLNANSKLAAQTIINQARNAAVVPVKASGVPQTSKTVRSDAKVLPRGSLVDEVV